MEEGKEKLISIEELILKAKALGVDFGKGNPKNRLRYYVKIGLLPHAKRKSFNGLPPTGAFPVEVLPTLIEIDKRLKEGKSISQIKKELKESLQKIFEPNKAEFFARDLTKEVLAEMEQKATATEEVIPAIKIRKENKFKIFLKNNVFLFVAIFFTIFLFGSLIQIQKVPEFLEKMVAALPFIERLWKREIPEIPLPPKREIFILPTPEPYLTLSVDTEILGKLKLRDSLTFQRGEREALFDFETLTENRTYIFPDLSGTVCLTTGNCAPLFGDVKTPGGIVNRLAKFSAEKEILNSSIIDLMVEGVSIFVDERGNVGLGTQVPREKLEVAGNLLVSESLSVLASIRAGGEIRASGDICTELGGGRCLSRIAIAAPAFVGVVGIGGTGEVNYFPIWTDARTLGNSIIYQLENRIGINTTTPNEALTLAGALSLAKITEPATTTGFGKIFVGQDNKLYFKNELGIVYDLTTVGVGVTGQGKTGQVAFWATTTQITGSDLLFWDIQNQRLGIGTSTPQQRLDVAGTIRTLGFHLPTGAQEGYILTSDGQGIATWRPAPPGTLPPGTFGQTLRHDGLGWVPTSFLFNTGSAIGIGTTLPQATLAVAGSGFFGGPLTIATSTISQLLLQYDTNNYLRFSITPTSSPLLTSDALLLNSLTGEIKIFDTSIKKGDKVLRTSIPIFKFPTPGQTSSTTFTSVSLQISTTTLANSLPPQFVGSQRRFAILLNFADDIPTTASSTWQIDFQTQPDFEFQFRGQNLPSLEEGVTHLRDNISGLLNDNWVLKVRVPAPVNKIRIFNIFLLVYDEIQ